MVLSQTTKTDIFVKSDLGLMNSLGRGCLKHFVKLRQSQIDFSCSNKETICCDYFNGAVKCCYLLKKTDSSRDLCIFYFNSLINFSNSLNFINKLLDASECSGENYCIETPQ